MNFIDFGLLCSPCLLKSADVTQIIVALMANFGKVFIKRLQTFFFNFFPRFYVFNVFLNFYLNVYYICVCIQRHHIVIAKHFNNTRNLRLVLASMSSPVYLQFVQLSRSRHLEFSFRQLELISAAFVEPELLVTVAFDFRRLPKTSLFLPGLKFSADVRYYALLACFCELASDNILHGCTRTAVVSAVV